MTKWFPQNEEKQNKTKDVLLSTLLFKFVLEIVANAVSQRKNKRYTVLEMKTSNYACKYHDYVESSKILRDKRINDRN
jgi:hypothetical protein